MNTWRNLIQVEMQNQGESFDDVVDSIFRGGRRWGKAERPPLDTNAALDRKFDSGYGGSEGCKFTLWTKNRVYFPVTYDGSEWVGSVPRNPCEEATEHQGGQ